MRNQHVSPPKTFQNRKQLRKLNCFQVPTEFWQNFSYNEESFVTENLDIDRIGYLSQDDK